MPDVDVCVRINGVSTNKCEKDLERVLSAEKSPNSICVPKIEEPGKPSLFFCYFNQQIGHGSVRNQF